MKKFIAAFLLVAGISYGEHVLMTVPEITVAPSNTTTYTSPVDLTGVLKTFTMVTSGGSATVTVSTASSKGLSVGAARTLFPASVVEPSGLESNITAYAGNDRLVITASSDTPTNTVTLKIGILYER